MKKIFLSIVVPVFKTDKTLELIVERALDLKNKILIGKNIEIIFVNDSPFFLPTVKTLQTLRKKNNFIKVVELTKNFGQHAATLAQAFLHAATSASDPLQQCRHPPCGHAASKKGSH